MKPIFKNQKWRLLGLFPIVFWLFTLTIYFSVAKNIFGPENASQAWQFLVWACPLAALLVGFGILLNNRFIAGAGALWGLVPVFLIVIASFFLPGGNIQVSFSESYSIPFLKLSEDYSSEIVNNVGQSGLAYLVISDFTIHWLGDFVFGIIALFLVGLSRWSFIGTSILFLFHSLHLKYICPFGPPGDPVSMFVQLVPLTIIWIILNQSIYGLKYKEQKNEKILFGVLTIYFCIAISMFQYLQTLWKAGPFMLLIGYFIILGTGKILVNKESFFKSLKRHNEEKNKVIVYISHVYAVLFMLFFFFMMAPKLISEGKSPIAPFILIGLIPFAVLFAIGFYLIPRLKHK